jgi:hypothetical protein
MCDDLDVRPADRQSLGHLAHEFLELLQEADLPRGVLCAVWLRLGVVLSDPRQDTLAFPSLRRLVGEDHAG